MYKIHQNEEKLNLLGGKREADRYQFIINEEKSN